MIGFHTSPNIDLATDTDNGERFKACSPYTYVLR